MSACSTFVILFLVHWTSFTMAGGSSYCHLVCRNGSVCSRLKAEVTAIGKLVQSGAMVESCESCPSTRTGIACDLPVDRSCIESAASSDLPCDICTKAFEISDFAGYMCQTPATEYCRPFDPLSDMLSYCTNGGKCVNSFFASGSFSTGLSKGEISHSGCRCAREYEGPHCELIKSPASGPQFLDKALFISAVLLVVGMLSILFWMRQRRYRQRVGRTAAIEHAEGNSSWM